MSYLIGTIIILFIYGIGNDVKNARRDDRRRKMLRERLIKSCSYNKIKTGN